MWTLANKVDGEVAETVSAANLFPALSAGQAFQDVKLGEPDSKLVISIHLLEA